LDHEGSAALLDPVLDRSLRDLLAITPRALLEQRYEKFRRMGAVLRIGSDLSCLQGLCKSTMFELRMFGLKATLQKRFAHGLKNKHVNALSRGLQKLSVAILVSLRSISVVDLGHLVYAD